MKTKSNKSLQQSWDDSYLISGGDTYLEELYEQYLKNPADVTPSWRSYFDKLASNKDVSHDDIRQYFLQLAKSPRRYAAATTATSSLTPKQEKVYELIEAYQSYGHLQADIDPLGLTRGASHPTLDLSHYGFTDSDMDSEFQVGSYLALQKPKATLREIVNSLKKTYASTIGFEYRYVTNLSELSWLQQRIEQAWPNFTPNKEQKLRILDRLVAADGLEKYLGFKYVGQKRFSLEGGDSLIPLLDTLVNHGAMQGIKEAILGMAHRGRLNVLVNVIGKKPAQIFAGFEGKNIDESNSGDVKYHLGYSSDVLTAYGPIHLAMAFNPSHLEIVSPVVQGSVRARQRRRRDSERQYVMPVQIHGDAAFAGQGVVMETFNMSQLRWFGVGGSIHIVINNQVGFTISNPKDARSTMYCTDIAKMVEAPVMHVNTNDPEAVVFAAQLAIDYHNAFKKDIVIDLVCYRRHGHNEADEPSATQPLMYQVIKTMPPTCTIYAQKLLSQNLITDKTEREMAEQYRTALENGGVIVKVAPDDDASYEFGVKWHPFIGKQWTEKADTSVPLKRLQAIGNALGKLPDGFTLQPQVKKTLEARQKMIAGELPLNWGCAETLAYATLLDEGYPIRLCGQDAARGTFAHRHSVLHDQKTDELYIPLSHVSPNQAQINIVDSFLSEEAVLAFEYGYATAEPNMLVLWEAQFGDFANGAQVVVDQFISSGEQKWKRLCGLIMLLPHGYEGMGPEHSSARLERYLQLCAQQNMQVCVPSTPAQIFHMLRRQLIRPYRKPLIVMTPKSFLRHPLAVSPIEELTKGEFQLIIPEIDPIDSNNVDRLIICCGKVYYDLLEKRRQEKLLTTAIIRIEQLYPFAEEQLKSIIVTYKKAKKVVWCQEEPQNQGAWYSTQHHLRACLRKDQELDYAGRKPSASPAVGYLSVHEKEQKELIAEAFSI